MSIANWPEGSKAAVVITFDVEQSTLDDLQRVTALLREIDSNATFFVVAGYYDGVSGALEPLRDYEVASKGWDQSSWSLDPGDQRESISLAHSWLTSKGFRPVGFRAPFLESNKETHLVLADLGYKYDSTDTGFMPTRINGVLEIPLSVAYDPFWNDDVKEYLPLTYLAFENTYDEGGLFTFYTLPEHIDERTEVFLRYMKGRDVWMASASEVADWWEKREKVSLKIVGEDAVITNDGESPVSGLTLKTKKGLVTLPDLNPGESIRTRI